MFAQGRTGRGGRRGFTLIELLVVVAIIGLLISILLPSLQKARDAAKTTVCASNMHQLALSTTYYVGDNDQRLPLIKGTRGGSDNDCNAPYRQYYQLILFFKYLPDWEMFRCPSAKDENSVRGLYGQTSTSAPPPSPDGVASGANASHYFVRKSDPLYEQVASPLGKNYWPQFSPYDLGPADEFPELYTQYWWNDYNPPTCGQSNIQDSEGRVFPHLNGGVADQFAAQNELVPITEYGWGLPEEKLRHNGKLQFGFLDGHAELIKKINFYDNVNAGNAKQDYDGYGNRTFYVWGMSRRGSNHGPN